MSNANAQPQKEKGLSVNSQIRCFKMQTGEKADGSMWGLITHTEKDSNKNVLQKYTLWVMNDSDFIANFPVDKTVDIRIDSITSVRPENKTYTKNGVKVNERVINLNVVISIVNVIDNNYKNNNYNNNDYKQQNNQLEQEHNFSSNDNQKANDENSIENMDISEFDFPF